MTFMFTTSKQYYRSFILGGSCIVAHLKILISKYIKYLIYV